MDKYCQGKTLLYLVIVLDLFMSAEVAKMITVQLANNKWHFVPFKEQNFRVQCKSNCPAKYKLDCD